MTFPLQYVREGVLHITDFGGYDHMLFLLALCASYSWKHWKKVLWLVTSFTIGHSLTLILAGLDLLRFSSDLIELLIPCTIVLTAIFNLVRIKRSEEGNFMYFPALVFGLIHGMGFSSYFRMITSTATDMIGHLLAFNIGVEIGQILIVSVILSLGWLVNRYAGVSSLAWKISLSLVSLVAGIYLILV